MDTAPFKSNLVGPRGVGWIGCHWSLEENPINLSRRYDQGPGSPLREFTGVTNLIMSG